jgi:hypothetical protein
VLAVCSRHRDEVRWPSGKAAACKAATRGFDSRPHLQIFAKAATTQFLPFLISLEI